MSSGITSLPLAKRCYFRVLSLLTAISIMTPGLSEEFNETENPGELQTLLSTRDIQLHFKTIEEGAAKVTSYKLYYTNDGGQNWRLFDNIHRGESPFPFTANKDGKFGFYITARDAAGQEEPGPKPGTSPQQEAIIDTRPPTIRLLRPHPDQRIPITTSLEIQWEVLDDHLGHLPVEISYSLDKGPWMAIWKEAPARDRRKWLMPFSQGEIRLLIRARDLSGNVTELETGKASVLSPDEMVRPSFLIVPSHSRRLTVPVYYRLESPRNKEDLLTPKKLAKVMIWYRTQGEDWKAGDVDRDRSSPLLFRAPGDGYYELLLFALTSLGDVIPAEIFQTPDSRPPPDAFSHGSVLVDTQEPRVQILEPPDGSQFQWGTSVRTKFVITEENPVKEPPILYFSVDRGAHWTTYPLEVPMRRLRHKNQYLGEVVLHIPTIETNEFLLKVESKDQAGNSGSASTNSDRPLSIGNFREDPRQVAQQLYERAAVLISQNEPEKKHEALGLFQLAIEKWELFPEAHHDLAVAIEQVFSGTFNDETRERALKHYRRALELDEENLAIRFSVVDALIRLNKNLSPDISKELEEEARKKFEKITWSDLLAPPQTELERQQLLEFRKKYLEWKENVFF